MKCGKIERWLNMYIDKELPGDKTAELHRHLAGCKKCNQRLNELSRVKGLVRAVPGYTVNPFLWTRIAAALSAEPALPVWPGIPSVLRLWVPAACILILVFSVFLAQVNKLEVSMYKEAPSIQKAILEIPAIPENMERITLNLLIYNSGKTEASYAIF